jgi:hypothetical protein
LLGNGCDVDGDAQLAIVMAAAATRVTLANDR